jgi:hypothetical protein
MRNLLIVFTIVVTAISCKDKKGSNERQAEIKDSIYNELKSKAEKDSANFTIIEWLDSVANFGTVIEGKKVEVKFRFKNTGSKPLLLTEVRAGCGCTTPDYTKEPVAPGKEGWVTGVFNSDNQQGQVHKYIMVRSNARNCPMMGQRLTFTGTVNKK